MPLIAIEQIGRHGSTMEFPSNWGGVPMSGLVAID
jgi:hypothetical protein